MTPSSWSSCRRTALRGRAVAPCGAVVDEAGEEGVEVQGAIRAPGGLELGRGREVGEAVAQALQGGVAGGGELVRPGQGLGEVGEAPGQVRGAPEVPLAVGEEPAARLVQGGVVADAGEDVLEPPALGAGVVDVAAGEERQGQGPGGGAEHPLAQGVLGEPVADHLHEEPIVEAVLQPGEGGPGGGDGRRVAGVGEGARERPGAVAPGEAEQALVRVLEERRVQRRLALGGVELALGEEAGEGAVAGVGAGQEHHPGPLGDRRPGPEGDLGAEHRGDAVAPAGGVEAHRAVEPVAVGEGEVGQAELGGPGGEVLGERGAFEEGEGRVGVELGGGRGVGHRYRTVYEHPRPRTSPGGALPADAPASRPSVIAATRPTVWRGPCKVLLLRSRGWLDPAGKDQRRMQSTLSHAITVFLGFFAIMNPIANVPIFLGPHQRRRQADRRRGGVSGPAPVVHHRGALRPRREAHLPRLRPDPAGLSASPVG